MTSHIQRSTASTIMPRARHPLLSWLRVLNWLASGLILGVGVYFLFIWPWISRWGASNEEVQQTFPGDDLIPNPAVVTTKAITIQTRPEAIWSWLVQLGVDRGGMYSYLWVENWLLRLQVKNSDEIRPEWQTLQVGDFIRFTPKDFALNPGPGLYIVAIEPNHALVGCFGMEGRPVDCSQSGTWQFLLTPQGDNTTRLLLRSVGAPSAFASVGGKFAHAFVFYMERKMLLGIKQRAEMLDAHQKLPVSRSEGR